MDFDAIFVKALRLLHSRAKESTGLLRQLLADALQQQPGSAEQRSTEAIKEVLPGKPASAGAKPKSMPETLKRSVSVKEEELKKRDKVEKRTYDKVKQEASHFQESVKRPRIDTPKSSSLCHQGQFDSSAVTLSAAGECSVFEADASAADIAVEMGLVCVLCRSFDVTSGNTLVECQDCHSLYHQECHKPPIADQDVNDPRLVWYCAKCTKNMKKMASKNQKPVKASLPPPPPAKESSLAKVPSKVPPDVPAVTQPPTHMFKRIEPKAATTTTTSSAIVPPSNKPIGLAGLAASLSGKSFQGQKAGGQASTSKASATSKPPALNSKPSPKPGTVHTKGGNGQTRSAASASQGLPATATNKAQTSSATAPGAVSGASASASKGGGGASSSLLMSADRRLQIMKKKAAAKMQEKRRLSSK